MLPRVLSPFGNRHRIFSTIRYQSDEYRSLHRFFVKLTNPIRVGQIGPEADFSDRVAVSLECKPQ